MAGKWSYGRLPPLNIFWQFNAFKTGWELVNIGFSDTHCNGLNTQTYHSCLRSGWCQNSKCIPRHKNLVCSCGPHYYYHYNYRLNLPSKSSRSPYSLLRLEHKNFRPRHTPVMNQSWRFRRIPFGLCIALVGRRRCMRCLLTLRFGVLTPQ